MDGSRDWIGATLQSTSEGGRQKDREQGELGVTWKRAGVWKGNQDWLIYVKEGSNEGMCSLPVRFGDRLTAP